VQGGETEHMIFTRNNIPSVQNHALCRQCEEPQFQRATDGAPYFSEESSNPCVFQDISRGPCSRFLFSHSTAFISPRVHWKWTGM
jgi:hypothetical protein